LLAHEAENNLMIGILDRGAGSLEADGWFMGRVLDGQGRNQLVALMTPPHNLILVAAEGADLEAAIARLVEALDQQQVLCPA
ncbi:MAG TPA: hypothetical protein PKE04_01320, partial [Clostridia bacterium]|nr:hypothetical protein [Clostridia bacterium]